MSCLVECSEEGDLGGVKTALRRGEDVNQRSGHCRGSTGLILASNSGHESVVELLLQQPGIEADITDSHGATALQMYGYRLYSLESNQQP